MNKMRSHFKYQKRRGNVGERLKYLTRCKMAKGLSLYLTDQPFAEHPLVAII
jgi:hypothetical protein